MTVIKGTCLCGSVRFKAPAPHHIDVCHCSMCRKWTGGAFLGVDYSAGGVEITESETLSWYDSSEWAQRGFCNRCGSSLFYRVKEDDSFMAICAGALEIPEGLSLQKEIFIDEKPDYYSFAGDQKTFTGAEFFASMQVEEEE